MSFKQKNSKLEDVLGSGNEEQAAQFLPEDYYRNPLYHVEKPLVIRMYLMLSTKSYFVVNGNEYFNYMMTSIIVFAGTLVGIESYPNLLTNTTINALDFLIIAIFSLEVMLKIWMEGLRPWK